MLIPKFTNLLQVTSRNTTKLTGRIVCWLRILSPVLWILGAMLFPDPDVNEGPETEYLELGSVLTSLDLVLNPLTPARPIVGIGGRVEFDSLDNGLTSHLGTELPISLDDGGNLPQCALGE